MEGERQRNNSVWLPLTRPLLGTWPAIQACALGWGLNWWPFGLQASTQSTEPHHPGHWLWNIWNGIIHVFFCVSLTSFNQHFVCDIQPHIVIVFSFIIVYHFIRNLPQFIYFPLEEHLSPFQFGTITSKWCCGPGWCGSWIERQKGNQKAASLIPSQDTCLGCGPGPQEGTHKRQPHIDVSLRLFFPPFPSV